MNIPYILMSVIAVTTMRRKKARPSGASGTSIVDDPSTQSGQQNRGGDARPISNRKRRNCARCVAQ